MDKTWMEVYMDGLLYELIKAEEEPCVEYFMDEIGVCVYDLEHVFSHIDFSGFSLENFCRAVLDAKADGCRYIFLDSMTGLCGHYKDYDAMLQDYICKCTIDKKKEVLKELLDK